MRWIGRGRKPSCAAFRPSCDRHVSRIRRSAGWLIPWPCATSARWRCGGWSACLLVRHRCGSSPARRARCWPGCRSCSTGWRCSSTLPADLVLAIVGSGSAYPIGCLPSSMRDGRSSRSVRSSFSGSAPPGRTAPQRSCSSRPCSCCSRQEAIWPTTAPSRSRSATAGAVLCAAMIKFAVLPALQTFPAFCVAIGLVLVPAGFAMAQNWQPAALAVFTATGANFMPLLAPTNQMSYDTAQFYNTALAVFAGCGVAALAYRLLPPLPPPLRARRLLALTLRDLRRFAIAPLLPTSEDWESRMYGRLGALPDQAKPVQRAQLLAALSVGTEINQLRHMAPHLGAAAELD